jgi:hypothetical protein
MDLLITYDYTHDSKTISTYDITDLHTLQISRAHAKSQSAFSSRFLVTVLNNGDSLASVR